MNDVDNILRQQIEKNKTPSVHYVFFDKDSIIHKFQEGFADILNKKPVNEQTTFNGFSVTKTFTALAVLQLEEKGKLNIDDPTNIYLPDFSYSENITIRQLLTHSAGIPNPNPLGWIHLIEEHQNFDRNQFFKEIFDKHNKTKSEPNEKFAYSNLGYFILGQIIEKVSGLTYEDYVRGNILQPIGIRPEELDFEIMAKNNHAKGYQKNISFMNLLLGFFIEKSKYMDKTEGKWKPFKSYYLNGASYGGLIGSPYGFVKYIQELLKPNCNLLTDECKDKMFTENFTISKKATGMCLSWFTGELNGQTYYSHAGGGGGYYIEIRIYPQAGFGSVIWFNRSGMRDERFLDKLDRYFLN